MMMLIATVANALGMVPKGLGKRLKELEIRRRINTTQIMTSFRLAWILTRDLETREDSLTDANKNHQFKLVRKTNKKQDRNHNNNNKKKRTCKIVDLVVPADHRIKLKECEKNDKYLDLPRELKKTMEHAGDIYTNCNWCFWKTN